MVTWQKCVMNLHGIVIVAWKQPCSAKIVFLLKITTQSPDSIMLLIASSTQHLLKPSLKFEFDRALDIRAAL